LMPFPTFTTIRRLKNVSLKLE
ncbi:cache domain protein, partial [Vibrio parahaemolyticus V-223/04]